MGQLDEIIFNAIESLRNNQKQSNEDTPVTMEKLKERLTTTIERWSKIDERWSKNDERLLGKEKLLNKPHGGNNSYLEMEKNSNVSPQTNSTQCRRNIY